MKDPIVTSLDARLAARVAAERAARGWPVADLAARSGVSRAMIAKIEKSTVKPTAALVGRLAAAFGLPLSHLFARMEEAPSRLARAGAQEVWTDPETRYRRRALSPPGDRDLQLTLVDLPPRARVRYPADAYTFIRQQIWVQRGTLTFREGGTTHTLAAGDCLQLGPPSPCTFENRTTRPCRYLVAVARR
jgi:transcriptional regulator with XRE-family HTH domain